MLYEVYFADMVRLHPCDPPQLEFPGEVYLGPDLIQNETYVTNFWPFSICMPMAKTYKLLVVEDVELAFEEFKSFLSLEGSLA